MLYIVCARPYNKTFKRFVPIGTEFCQKLTNLLESLYYVLFDGLSSRSSLYFIVSVKTVALLRELQKRSSENLKTEIAIFDLHLLASGSDSDSVVTANSDSLKLARDRLVVILSRYCIHPHLKTRSFHENFYVLSRVREYLSRSSIGLYGGYPVFSPVEAALFVSGAFADYDLVCMGRGIVVDKGAYVRPLTNEGTSQRLRVNSGSVTPNDEILELSGITSVVRSGYRPIETPKFADNIFGIKDDEVTPGSLSNAFASTLSVSTLLELFNTSVAYNEIISYFDETPRVFKDGVQYPTITLPYGEVLDVENELY